MTDQYKPISCERHSEYELAIMQKVMLHLAWKDEFGQQHIGNVMPLDLKTRAQKEFLIGQSNDGEVHYIRLDKISHSNVTEVTQS
jgi:transcriptional antiterminator Rof (Rho-off)